MQHPVSSNRPGVTWPRHPCLVTSGTATRAVSALFTFFDNRYAMYESYVSNDTYTAFVSSPFSTGPYTTVMKGRYSHNMMISEENMRNIIADLNMQCMVDCVKWHSDLSRYKLTSVGILHEVFIATTTHRVVSELQVNGFEVAR